jgi:CheY-like chemotaxis protein
MRILIVEDNLKMRELLRAFLTDMAEVSECADGDEALVAFNNCQPDWVLMDVQMQRVGGIAATRELKNSFPASRVVMLSKHTDAEIREACLSAGACAYFVKDNLFSLRDFLLAEKRLTEETKC